MNCQFCQQPCHLQTNDGYCSNSNEVWECSNHLPIRVRSYLEFIRIKNCRCGDWADNHCCPKENVYKTIAFFHYKGQPYFAFWNHEFQQFSLYDAINFTNGLPSVAIFRLDFIPKDLNPENMEKKLPLWITFS